MRTVHAAQPGLTGDHRTGGSRCPCEPLQFVDLNEPTTVVLVHQAMPAEVPICLSVPPAHARARNGSSATHDKGALSMHSRHKSTAIHAPVLGRPRAARGRVIGTPR